MSSRLRVIGAEIAAPTQTQTISETPADEKEQKEPLISDDIVMPKEHSRKRRQKLEPLGKQVSVSGMRLGPDRRGQENIQRNEEAR